MRETDRTADAAAAAAAVWREEKKSALIDTYQPPAKTFCLLFISKKRSLWPQHTAAGLLYRK